MFFSNKKNNVFYPQKDEKLPLIKTQSSSSKYADQKIINQDEKKVIYLL
jgi:hypothetical protein